MMLKESTMDLLAYHSAWRPDDSKYEHPSLVRLIASPDFVDANQALYYLQLLQQVNLEVNGPVPSQTVNLHIDSLPRPLVFMMNDTREKCWDSYVYAKDVRRRCAIYAIIRWIDVCWGWILDGDIDDVINELNEVYMTILYEEMIRLQLVSDTE